MWLAELDVDARGEGLELALNSNSRNSRNLPASICRGHHDQLLVPLGIKQLPHPI